MATHAPPEPGAVHALTRWVRPRAAVLLLVATAAAAAPPLEARQQQAGSGDSDAQPGAVAAALDSVVRATLAEQGVPGASVLVRRGGTVLLERGYGLAEVENEVPAGPETAYRIGSVTKQFTAAAVLRLVEQDAIDLDASLERYLPEYDTGGRRVTVRQLLNHTSGIRSYTGLPSWRGVRRLATTHDEMLRVVMDEPFDFEPGTDYRYNNSGYYLLGVIVERVSGLAYEAYLAREFFGPLGLGRTVYCDTRRILPHRAQGYSRMAGELANADMIDMSQPFSAGALCSTVGDLDRWSAALHGGEVLGPEAYRMMTTPLTLPEGRPLDYGFGLTVGEGGGAAKISHGGSINGFTAALAYYPQADLSVAVLLNADFGSPAALERRLAATALGVP